MKILKFDTLYPASFLTAKIESNRNVIAKMDFDEFNQWLINLRLNFSDYYSYNLNLCGNDAKEIFILSNQYYLNKIGRKYFGCFFYVLKVFFKVFGKYFKFSLFEAIIDKIIKVEQPDIIFIREHSTISSLFWNRYRTKSLVVSRMECVIPKYWCPGSFDLVYTNIKTYREFLSANKIPTNTNYSGIDERVISELTQVTVNSSVVFVGGLGNSIFKEKTDFLENILRKSDGRFSFSWWGYKENDSFDYSYPLLASCYNGVSGGLEMFNIYYSAKIVLNDYGLVAGGQGMNQRIYEVLGVGGFLLTRESQMFDTWGNVVATFKNEDDCIRKILYYLSHEEERIYMCKKGQDFVLRNFNYKDIMKKLSAELQEAYNNKFNNNL